MLYGQMSFGKRGMGKRHRVVVDGWASSDAACQAGGLGSIPGPGQSYV
jgi:hypothetical protein